METRAQPPKGAIDGFNVRGKRGIHKQERQLLLVHSNCWRRGRAGLPLCPEIVSTNLGRYLGPAQKCTLSS